MIASTLLAIPFVPVFYIMMQRVREGLGKPVKLETEASQVSPL
jgi:hypothetical protein